MSRQELAEAVLRALKAASEPLTAKAILQVLQTDKAFGGVTKPDVNSVLYRELTSAGTVEVDSSFRWRIIGSRLTRVQSSPAPNTVVPRGVSGISQQPRKGNAMISFRCRKHRQPLQQLWQVAKDGSHGRAGRPIAGAFKEGLTPGGWVKEDRKLVPGLYCQRCLAEGDNDPLADYDEQDLADAGLLDTPHVGQGADDFQLEVAWDKLSKSLSKLVVATRDRMPSPAKIDTRLRSDARLQPDLRDALYGRILKDSPVNGTSAPVFRLMSDS